MGKRGFIPYYAPFYSDFPSKKVEKRRFSAFLGENDGEVMKNKEQKDIFVQCFTLMKSKVILAKKAEVGQNKRRRITFPSGR